MRPGADSLDRMGILRSWRLSSWLSRWARCREQPWDSYKHKFRALSASARSLRPPPPPETPEPGSGHCSPRRRKGAWPKDASAGRCPTLHRRRDLLSQQVPLTGEEKSAKKSTGTQQNSNLKSASTQGDGRATNLSTSPGILL